MKRLSNLNATSLDDAVAQLAGQRAAVVGGGSDLLGMIKDSLAQPDVLVNLRAVGSLDHVDERADGVHIGGLVTLDALSRHPRISADYRVLAEAAASVATPQIRNVATVAGNICQRPWCWYFRQGFPCYKHGGDRCFSRAGENQFNAIVGGGPSFIVHPSDTAPALVALGARFRVVGPEGVRWVPAAEFFVLPRIDVSRENVLERDEILAEVALPIRPSGTRTTYAKVLDREAWTHAVVSVAAVLEMERDIIRRAAVVLGGVAPIPWQVPAVEALLVGQPVTAELATAAGRLAVKGAQPLSKNRYKLNLTAALVRRTLMSLAA